MNSEPHQSHQFEVPNQLQYFQKGTKREKLSLILVGKEEFVNLMQHSIHDYNNKEKGSMPLIVSVAEKVEDIITSSETPHVDLIVFLMDTGRKRSIEQVERDICSLEPVYLCDRTILVNCCNQLTPVDRGISSEELFNLTQKYHLHLFHGNIKNPECCSNLAQRILNITPTICGLNTGIPIALHFPGDRHKLF